MQYIPGWGKTHSHPHCPCHRNHHCPHWSSWVLCPWRTWQGKERSGVGWYRCVCGEEVYGQTGWCREIQSHPQGLPHSTSLPSCNTQQTNMVHQQRSIITNQHGMIKMVVLILKENIKIWHLTLKLEKYTIITEVVRKSLC